MSVISAIKAISLGDLTSNAERILLGARSFSAAGLAVNDATAQEATVTLSGTFDIGDVWTVTLGGTPYTYTALAGATNLAGVATALAAVIDASDAYVSTAAGAVITITAAVPATAFTITATATNVTAGTDNQAIAVATTHTSVQSVLTANRLRACIGGVLTAVAATPDITVGGAVLPVSSFRWYLVSVVAAGTMTTYPSTDNVAVLPDLTAGSAPVGAFKVVTDSTHTFTPGTTPLNGAGITTTYFDLSSMPVAGLPA
jgi:hypothetical protein